MGGLANDSDTHECPHCGQQMRRGMIRCRECGKNIQEVTEELDFALTGHDLIPNQDPTCPLCGAVLEPGATDCASCTSALLDQLLNGPAEEAPISKRHTEVKNPSNSKAGLRVKRAAPRKDAAGRSASGSAPGAAKPAAARARATGPTGASAASQRSAAPVPQAKATAPEAIPAPSAPQPVDDADGDEPNATTDVETSAACTALLASLATANEQLRSEIATALGKLGDKQAMVPLERYMGDKDVRVRRAVATALVKLGHVKGESLLGIAERLPANAMLTMARATPAKVSRGNSGRSSIDSGTLLKVGGGIAAVAIIGGGIWYWMSQPSSGTRARKGKRAATAAKASAAKKANLKQAPPAE